jgi:hypothetical protein
MLLDQPVVIAIDGAWKRFVRVVGNIGRVETTQRTVLVREGAWSAADWQHSLDILTAAEPADSAVTASLPTEPEPEGEESSTPADRRVQAALIRAKLLSGQGRFEEAESAFSEAIVLDPLLDFAGDPDFWSIERGGQDAAVRALESAGRGRDGMILRARLENRYRPRLVRSA